MPEASPSAPYPAEWESDVVLTDGATVHLRPIRPDDGDGLLSLYSRLSDESIYLRFFSPVPAPTERQLHHLTNLDYDARFAIVAELGTHIVGIARYDRQTDGAAEVAFTIEDDQQGRGIGTILLEHLAAIARAHGIRRFVAWTLSGNAKMLRVFSEAGFGATKTFEDGNVLVTFDIAPTAASVAIQHEREHISEARSIGRLLRPSSIAVLGASRREGTIGHAVFRNLIDGGFVGTVYPVNPSANAVAGVRAYGSILDVPDHVDLALIVVPAAHVAGVVDECVRKGVHGFVVISAGFAEVGGDGAAAERAIVATARRHGARLIGPNCMGIVNTSADVRANATFAPFMPVPGRVAFASQSGGLGIELLARAGALGLGTSSFVSLGNKADVSGNDLLQYWEEDADTDVILLYLESFGNPHKFARLARRVARRKPIIAVKSGRSPAGARGALSHTAALASPDVAVDALFRQAGIIRVDTLEQLFDTAAVVLHQPLPPGRRVAIISNGGGPGILAADAAVATGLAVEELSADTQARLRSFLSPDAGVRNPVDLVASASAEIYEQAMRVLLDDDHIDALLIAFVPPLVTRAEDVADAISRVASEAGAKPVVACFLGRNGTLDLLPADGEARRIPTFAFPESAAAALGRAADHADWRRRPEGTVPVLLGIDPARARAMVDDCLGHHPNGEWLDPAGARDLVACFGIPVVPTEWTATAAGAAAAADALGYPVALKAGSGNLVHKSDVGGVRLGLESRDAVSEAFATMEAGLGHEMGGGVVQPMLPTGVETIVGVTRDPSFGSLVLFGMGGFAAELVRDTALRIVPLTDVDAHELVGALRGSPLLFGYRNTPACDVGALEDLILRVGALADALPEIAELDCNPVVVTASGATAVDIKIRLAPVESDPHDGVRHLR